MTPLHYPGKLTQLNFANRRYPTCRSTAVSTSTSTSERLWSHLPGTKRIPSFGPFVPPKLIVFPSNFSTDSPYPKDQRREGEGLLFIITNSVPGLGISF
ncbi:hypothetical protein VTK73DRAFT_7029 [Phialemonium thermophilum]|uniref:Uncharacterized protein n=1 Tax=Phialemonium thermophilum TaxID=223376 RepID=A0ABR3XTS1_9PEZI